ncbi:MAG: UDP-N-acetylmuramoyl-tripeptide--D-alanyl-D-alanine ligase [Eubacterium sp.]|nr:UDP-N-acetylmuramoyl-tripeptide--D-alanyl-D-alanine ligase [Eubacterium sp.]MDY5496874.1 UDP-N-acetylmuramoyl-tripeptide--D-alanyl-D-alanine ligase [Anaerobutyricum sp.]
MENITVKEIVEATGGILLCGDDTKVIRSFSIDSRQGDEDSIFVPIIGENVDAHKFIDSALKINGATFTSEHDSAVGAKPWIKVDDTVEAMQKLGTYYRNRMNLPVVAVTGSVGKTTTREMIGTALASQKRVFQTIGNQNSQIGVPLTLSRMTPEDEVAVLEIGMSERGQIEKLTKMIRPNIAVVTMIGVSHIAQLKTRENICLEKMDIVKGLPEDGLVFLNGDDAFLAPYRGKLSHKTFFYGMDRNCDYRAENVEVGGGQTRFVFFYKEGGEEKHFPVILGTMGVHNVRNALVALGVSHQMGLNVKEAAKALETFHGQRQQMHRLKSCTLIDDTYNASPDSMKASVNVLSSMEGVKGRRIAALADMLELGEQEKEYHYEVGAYIARTKVDEVAVYGELSKEIIRGVTENSDSIVTKYFSTREELASYLHREIRPEDVLLLKGSNGMKLKEIVDTFTKEE